MKDLLLPVGLLFAVVVLVYFLWMGPAATVVPSADTRAFARTPTTPPVAAAPKAAEKKGVRATLHDVPDPPPLPTKPALVEPSVTQASVIVEPPPPIPVQAPAPRRPAPDPTAVTTGMAASRVVELFGSPDLKTATIQKGGLLLETYVYTSPEGQFVRIPIRGGRVVNDSQ